jgi:hypothetical protein
MGDNRVPAMVRLLVWALAFLLTINNTRPDKEREVIDWACGMLRDELTVFSGIVKDATYN